MDLRRYRNQVGHILEDALHAYMCSECARSLPAHAEKKALGRVFTRGGWSSVFCEVRIGWLRSWSSITDFLFLLVLRRPWIHRYNRYIDIYITIGRKDDPCTLYVRVHRYISRKQGGIANDVHVFYLFPAFLVSSLSVPTIGSIATSPLSPSPLPVVMVSWLRAYAIDPVCIVEQ